MQSTDIRCGVNAAGRTTGTLTVNAGDTATFKVYNGITHPGPLLWYMAKAPSTVNGWDGSGLLICYHDVQLPDPFLSFQVRFGSRSHKLAPHSPRDKLLGRLRVCKLGIVLINVDYCITGLQSVSVKIPSAVPTGEYILRVESIALHVSGSL